MKNKYSLRTQHGMILIEGMMAILIFSMGILAIVGMQAVSIKNSADAKYRADASLLANQIIGQMWANQGPDQTYLPGYAHYSGAGDSACTPSGSASSNANVTNWIADVTAVLPGATAANQQIAIGANNLVTVTICWKGPQDPVERNFVATTQISS